MEAENAVHLCTIMYFNQMGFPVRATHTRNFRISHQLRKHALNGTDSIINEEYKRSVSARQSVRVW